MISFVITARNEAPDVLERTVRELCATTPASEREVIVVDDGSTTPVANLPSDIMVLRNHEPTGVSRARRAAFTAATGEVFVCLDAHMTFAADWLDRMLAHVDSGALLCSAFWDYERTCCHCYGADFEWCTERDYSRQRSPGFLLRHRTAWPGGGAPEVPMVIGACYMLLRSTYRALGGCSPMFRVWGADEQDFSARAWLAGVGVRCVTEARVGHFWRGTFPYTVQFDDLEFNQLALVRSVFEEPTVERLEPLFEPVPERVKQWFDDIDIRPWRSVVQAPRRASDAEFFARFVPELHARVADEIA